MKEEMNMIIKGIFKAEQPFATKKKPSGFAAILGMIIAGAVGLATVIAIVSLGTDSLKIGISSESSSVAKALAESCIEEGLWQIREDEDFSGDGGLDYSDGECTYQVLDQGEGAKEIRAVGIKGDNTRRVKILLDQISPQINITYWQEVAGF